MRSQPVWVALASALAVVLMPNLTAAQGSGCVLDKDVVPIPSQYPCPQPLKATDYLFVNPSLGLDQDCIFRTHHPITFNVDIPRYVGDRDKLLDNKLIDKVATIYICAFDVDYNEGNGICSPYAWEYDKVSVNNHVLPDSLLKTVKLNLNLQQCIWGVAALPCSTQWLNFPSEPSGGNAPTPAHNEIKVEIDIGNAQPIWCTAFKWAAIDCHAALPIVFVHGGLATSASEWDNFWAGPGGKYGVQNNGLPVQYADVPVIPLPSVLSIPAVSSTIAQLRNHCNVKHVNAVTHSKGSLDVRCTDRFGPDQISTIVSIAPPNAGIAGDLDLLGLNAYDPPAIFKYTVASLANLSLTDMVGFNAMFPPKPAGKYRLIAGEYDATNDKVRGRIWRWGAAQIIGTPSDLVIPLWSIDGGGFPWITYFTDSGHSDDIVHLWQTGNGRMRDAADPTLNMSRSFRVASSMTAPVKEATITAGDSAVATGGVYEKYFNVGSAQALMGAAFYSSGDVDVALISPSGTVYDSTYALAHPEVVTGDSAFWGGHGDVVYVPTPAAGAWKVRATVAANGAGGSQLPVNVQVFGQDMPVKLEVWPYWAGMTKSGQNRILAKLSDGATVLTGMTFSGSLISPSGSSVALSFRDDGAGGDSLSGDGLATAQVAPPGASGPWRVWVTGKGTGPHGLIELRSAATLDVTEGSAVPTGVYADRTVESDGTNIGVEQLAIDAQVTTTAAGTYAISATLVGPNGTQFSGGGMATLSVGTGTLTALFDGSELFKSRESGRFRLSSVTLAELTNGLPMITASAAPNWLTTASYGHTAFAHDNIEVAPGAYAIALPAAGQPSKLGKIKVAIPVEINSPGGQCAWVGRLTDASGREIENLTTENGRWMGGSGIPDTLNLEFDATCIARSGYDGPYYVRDVLFYNGYIATVLADPIATPPYRASDFALPSYYDLLGPHVRINLCPQGDGDSLEYATVVSHYCGCGADPVTTQYSSLIDRGPNPDAVRWDDTSGLVATDSIPRIRMVLGADSDTATYRTRRLYPGALRSALSVKLALNGQLFPTVNLFALPVKSYDLDGNAIGSVDRFDSTMVWDARNNVGCYTNDCTYADYDRDGVVTDADVALFAQHSALHHHVRRHLLVPNGGESYDVGQAIPIQWVAGLGDSARATLVLLKQYDPSYRLVLATDLRDTGAYSYSVPANILPSHEYRVEVIHTAGVWKFDGHDVGRDTTDGMFTISGDGGGCPTLDALGQDGFYTENTILGRTASAQLLSDVYHLRQVPLADSGYYALKVRENEQEVTTLDATYLALVDHSPGTAVVPVGSGYQLGTLTPAAHVQNMAGQDLTALASGTSDGFVADAGDTLIVDLDAGLTARTLSPESVSPAHTNSGGGGFLMGDMGKILPPDGLDAIVRVGDKSGATVSPYAIDTAVLGGTGILVQVPDSALGWRTLEHDYPRAYFADSYYDSVESGRVRLVFLTPERIRFLGRVTPQAGEIHSSLYAPVAASHSRLGEVKDALVAIGGATTTLVPGDTISLRFTASPVPEGLVRDCFFLSRGSYTTPPNGVSTGSHPGGLPGSYSYALGTARPNPSARDFMIDYSLARTGPVVIRIYNVAGRLVRTLVNESLAAGPHVVVWDGLNQDGRQAASGVYFYRMAAGSFTSQRKAVLLTR